MDSFTTIAKKNHISLLQLIRNCNTAARCVARGNLTISGRMSGDFRPGAGRNVPGFVLPWDRRHEEP